MKYRKNFFAQNLDKYLRKHNIQKIREKEKEEIAEKEQKIMLDKIKKQSELARIGRELVDLGYTYISLEVMKEQIKLARQIIEKSKEERKR